MKHIKCIWQSINGKFQLYITHKFTLFSQIKLGKYNETIELLNSGIINLFKYNQIGSAIELSMKLIEVYNQGKVEISEDSRNVLLNIFKLFPINQSKEFVKECIKWSSNFIKCGDPILHHEFGMKFLKGNNIYRYIMINFNKFPF